MHSAKVIPHNKESNGSFQHGELDGWQEAIAEARSQLEALELRKKGLLEVIARFEQFRKLGEPWPLKNETAGTATESVPGQIAQYQ